MLIFTGILVLFRFYSHILQRVGKLIKLFKDVKTDKEEDICDEDWNFLIDVDE